MDSLRVVAFNTQLRSYAMTVGVTMNPLLEGTADSRAKAIVKRILASPFDYDIVGLCEVFDETAREILAEGLKGKYPFAVIKADTQAIGTYLLGAATVLSTSAALAAYGLAMVLNTDFEDSGLMLFSKFPFDKDGFGDPVVTYWPFTESAHLEGLSAKGVLRVRVLLDGTLSPCDIAITHMQASYDSDDEYSDVRTTQLIEVANLLGRVTGDDLPDEQQVIFMGDLNVLGNYQPGPLNQPGIVSAEWQSVFGNGGYFQDVLRDLWAFEQSPGLAYATPTAIPGELVMPYPGLWDLGLTNTSGKRLDYIFARPSGQQKRLALQHIQLGLDLTRSNLAIDGQVIPFTSDHRALRADFGREGAYCRAAKAVVAPAVEDWRHDGTLSPGSMKWHRFDSDGAYAFRVEAMNGTPDPSFEVFLTSDLSQPFAPYRSEETKFGRTYLLPSAPFFVRVFCADRTARTEYALHAHRYTGDGAMNAIPLCPRKVCAHVTTDNRPLNSDDPDTPYDETDSVWFYVGSDAPDAGGEHKLDFTVRSSYDRAVFSLLVLLEGPGGRSVVASVPAAVGETTVSWSTPRREKYFVLVQRDDPTFPAGHPQKFEANRFDVFWTSNLSYLFGHQGGRGGHELGLLCSDETDGFLGSEAGSDDIRAKFTTDGSLVLNVSEDDLGPFDETGEVTLEPWISVVRYLSSYKVDLVEVDLAADDRASVTIPPFASVLTHPAFNLESQEADGTVRGWFKIDFGDGKYRFYCTVTDYIPI